MAYNTSKGPRDLGDIKNEDDVDTQIDFESDKIAFKTNNLQRLEITNLHVSASGNVSGAMFYGDGSRLSNVGGGGSMSNWVLSADAGSNQTIENTNTVDIAGGTGISTVASATDTVTINLDYAGTDNFIDACPTNLEGSSIATNDTIIYHDASDDDIKKGLISDLPFADGTMSSFTLRGDAGSTDSIGNANTLDVAGGTGISTVNARSVTTNTMTINLDNTSVTPNSYTYASITVDQQGRLTAAGNGVAPAITTYNNEGDNRIITSVNSNTVQAETGLTYDGSNFRATGQISASLGITGSAIYTAGGILEITNNNGNPRINSSMNHLVIRNDRSNKHIRLQLGDNAGATEVQVRNNSNVKVANIDSLGSAEFNQLTSSKGVELTGSLKVNGSHHAKYNYRNTAGTYNVIADDNVIIFNNAGASTAVLPGIASDNKGVQYIIKNRGGGNVTLTGSAGLNQLIDGNLTFVVGNNTAVKIMAVEPIGAPYEWILIGKFQ